MRKIYIILYIKIKEIYICIHTILSVLTYLENLLINSNDQGLLISKFIVFMSSIDNPDKTEPYVCKAA